MKYIFLFNFLFVIFLFKAQHWCPVQHDTLIKSKNEIIFSACANYSSTSLDNSLTKKLFYGGEITEAIKDKSFKLHGDLNRFGTDVSVEIEYRNFSVNLFKKKNWGFIIKSGIYTFLAAQYSKDLFGVTFYGNEMYQGQLASFSGTKISAYSFEKLGFGWLDKKSKSSVCLNVFNLTNTLSAKINTGGIYQSNEGDTLIVLFDGEASFINSKSFSNGLGLGIDFDIRIPLTYKADESNYIQFLGRNLGLVSLTQAQTIYRADSVYTFTAYTFDQLLNNGDILTSPSNILDSVGILNSEKKSIVFLPGFLQVSKLINENSKNRLQEFYGIRMYLSSIYTPMLFIGANYRVGKILNIGLNGSYGGFTSYRLGMYSSLKLRNWNLALASENLISKNGESLILRLQCAF
jgi:hypothetical protein